MEKICQSCGMPLTNPSELGTNKDNNKNDDYCIYCFKDGDFTQDITMDEMINHCAKFVSEFNKDSEQQLTETEAIAQMKNHFPMFKRWAKS